MNSIQVHATMASSATLFQNATIISYDSAAKSLKTLRNAYMLVQDGQITQLSENQLNEIPSDIETVDATDKIISPGFVDTHHHMWQTQFRTLAKNTTLNEYFVLYGQTGPAHKNFTPQDIYLGQLASALEMIDCGTTTVLDHAHGTFSDEHVDAAVNATFDSGLRVFYAHCVQPMDGNGYTYEKALNKFRSLLKDERFASKSNPVELALAYDGFAFVPPERSMEVMDVVINHNNEGKGAPIAALTSHFVAGPYGATNSPNTLNSMPTSVVSQPKLQKKLPVVLSHASFLDQKDAFMLRKNPHVTISTTPESETHYGHTSAGADMCQDCASLGVDTHFTFSTYMPAQARLWLQLLRSKHYTQTVVDNWSAPVNNPMTAESAFLLATQKGGESLGRDDLGVIKVGAQADIVIYDTASRAGLWGSRDPAAAVVLHTGSGGDVEAVMVAGKWLKKDHKIVSPLVGGENVIVEDVRKRFIESATKIQKTWEAMDAVILKEGEPAAYGLSRFAKCYTVDVRRK